MSKWFRHLKTLKRNFYIYNHSPSSASSSSVLHMCILSVPVITQGEKGRGLIAKQYEMHHIGIGSTNARLLLKYEGVLQAHLNARYIGNTKIIIATLSTPKCYDEHASTPQMPDFSHGRKNNPSPLRRIFFSRAEDSTFAVGTGVLCCLLQRLKHELVLRNANEFYWARSPSCARLVHQPTPLTGVIGRPCLQPGYQPG